MWDAFAFYTQSPAQLAPDDPAPRHRWDMEPGGDAEPAPLRFYQPPPPPPPAPTETWPQMRRRHQHEKIAMIESALRDCPNGVQAAIRLGVDRSHLKRFVANNGLDWPFGRE